MADQGKTDKNEGKKLLAVVQVRGMVKTQKEIRYTLQMLNLGKQQQCSVITDTPIIRGMLQKVKDYVTWGELHEKTFAELVQKRGREDISKRGTDRTGKYAYHRLEVQKKKYFPSFYLNPPRQGYERKGIKVSFQAGGALGYRGEAINNLLERMW